MRTGVTAGEFLLHVDAISAPVHTPGIHVLPVYRARLFIIKGKVELRGTTNRQRPGRFLLNPRKSTQLSVLP